MKQYLLVGVICLALAVPGCAWFRKTTLEAIDEYTETVKMEKKAIWQLAKEWPFVSAQLKAALGARYGALPSDVIKAWEKLDKFPDADKLTDKQLGEMSGTWFLMSYEMVREGVKAIAPDVLGLLPAFL